MASTLRAEAVTERGLGFVRLVGRLDSTTYPAAEKAVTAALRQGAPMLILDVSGLEYVSSVGMGILIAAYDDVSARGGRVILAALQRGARAALEKLGILHVFALADTVGDALRLARERRAIA